MAPNHIRSNRLIYREKNQRTERRVNFSLSKQGPSYGPINSTLCLPDHRFCQPRFHTDRGLHVLETALLCPMSEDLQRVDFKRANFSVDRNPDKLFGPQNLFSFCSHADIQQSEQKNIFLPLLSFAQR